MEDNNIGVSIIIVTRNEGLSLNKSLATIFQQKTNFFFEIIGIDTESEDETASLFNQYSAKIISVKKEDFHHVKTRNYALKEAKGKYIIFLTGDAIPQGEFWLENLIKPLIENESVAASYSRQLPYPDAYPWEARDIFSGGGIVRKVKEVNLSDPYQLKNYQNHLWEFIAFSNVSACYRKELLLKYPFNESISELEDQEWCKRMLEFGYKIVFEPTSVVMHSHNDTLKRLYKRQFVYGRCFSSFVNKPKNSLLCLLTKIFYEIILDYLFIVSRKGIFRRKFIFLVKAPIFRFVKKYAFYRGFNRAY